MQTRRSPSRLLLHTACCGLLFLSLTGPLCLASVYDGPQSLQDFRSSTSPTAALDAETLSHAIASGQTGLINQLVALFDGGLRTLLDLMYAANPFAKETTERNTQVLPRAQQHVNTRSHAIMQNALNASLTGYVGFQTVNGPVDPQSDTSSKGKYVGFVQRTQSSALINSDNITVPDPEEEETDLSILVEQVRSRVYANYLKSRYTQDLSRHFGNSVDTVTRRITPISASGTAASGNDLSRLVDALSRNTNVYTTLYNLWLARIYCLPKPDAPPSDAYDDCRLNAEKEAALQQKFLMSLLFSSNNQADIARVLQKNNNYSARNFLHPKGYNNAQDSHAATRFLQRIQSYAALPSLTPPDLPRPLSPKQSEHYTTALQNAASQSPNQPSPLDRIAVMQKGYKKAVRTLITVKQTALRALYQHYTQRQYDPNIDKLQLKDMNGNRITNAQALARYAASWRVFSPQFYEKINTASSATLLRQLLILSAERRWQEYQLLEQLKQQQVLLSLLVVQGMKGDLETVNDLYKGINGQIQDLLSGNNISAASLASPDAAQSTSESLAETITGGEDE